MYEVEVGEWLLKHGETCLEPLKTRISPNYKLLPDFAFDMFLDSYEEEVLKILKKSVMESLNLNPEQIDLFFNKQYVKMLLGNQIFSPGE